MPGAIECDEEWRAPGFDASLVHSLLACYDIGAAIKESSVGEINCKILIFLEIIIRQRRQ